MSAADRQPHKTAVVINQQFLDYSMDNLESDLRLTVEIEAPEGLKPAIAVTFAAASATITTLKHHGYVIDEQIKFTTNGSLPPEIVVGTVYYVVAATSLTFEVSATVGGGSIVMSGVGTGSHSSIDAAPLIRASDRNHYKGAKFFKALTNFPIISRTVGEWLSPVVEFSSLALSINNVLGDFNSILPGGSLYEGMLGRPIDVKLGLRDVEATYFSIFKGFVSEIGGFKRDTSKFTVSCRDDFSRINVEFPTVVFDKTTYPKIANSEVGTAIPVIYGDWTTVVEQEGNVTPIVTNGADPRLEAQPIPVQISVASPAVFTSEDHRFSSNDRIHLTTDGTLPTPLAGATNYYVIPIDDDNFQVSASSGPGAPVNTTLAGSGVHNYQAQDRVNVQLTNSVNDLSSFDSTSVWVERNEAIYRFNSADITNIGAGNKTFEIVQNSGLTLIDGANYLFESGDIFTIKVKGKTLGGGTYDNNPLEIARDILITYSPATFVDFDANWDTFRDKASPAESSLSTIKCRVWRREPVDTLEFALSILEQVRMEAFISRNLKIKLNSLHFDDWTVSPSHRIRNFDLQEGDPKVSIDERNNFNTAQGFYNFSPRATENISFTPIFTNLAALAQPNAKRIAKKIEFPNLYVLDDVNNQTKEVIKLASSYAENLTLSVTNRSLLQDIGDFVKMSVTIGSTVWNDVPMMIRDYSVDPKGLKIRLKLWSFEMTPFGNPSGWNPGTSGIVGGDTATITEE